MYMSKMTDRPRPGTHIRPHCGVTNTQLKAHLGVLAPAAPRGCAAFTVGGEASHWRYCNLDALHCSSL